VTDARLTPDPGTDGLANLVRVSAPGQGSASDHSARVQNPCAPKQLKLYAAGLAGIATALFAGLLLRGDSVGTPWTLICLSLVAVVAERASIRLTERTEISISLLPTLFAGVLFGPVAAMIVGAASNLFDLRSSSVWPALKWLTYTSTRALTGALVGTVALVGQTWGPGHIGGIVVGTVIASFCAETADIGFAALTSLIRGNGDARSILKSTVPLATASVPLYAPLVAMLVIAYEEVSPWTLPLFMAPTLAAHKLYALYHDQRKLTADVLSINTRLERANLSFATALVATLDARDQYTAGHSAAVAIYARDIAARIGLSETDQQLVHLCGLVHDIGKVGLPAALLEKPGALTLEERRQMETHAVIGERILANVDDYEEIATVVRHHHERVDGHGYPDGLAGDAIPLLSRIIAVADAYNAMTSDRPYRDAMPSRVARMRLAQAVESQFDTTVVAAFEAILASAPESYRSGARPDFRARVHLDRKPHPRALEPASIHAASFSS
jgi:putative nucleotidyltransferase with HDIG domain